jgi:hypothetical protein
LQESHNLGAVSLDPCAALLGSMQALLPIFARDILASGPCGLASCAQTSGGGAAARIAGRATDPAVARSS